MERFWYPCCSKFCLIVRKLYLRLSRLNLVIYMDEVVGVLFHLDASLFSTFLNVFNNSMDNGYCNFCMTIGSLCGLLKNV